MLRQNVDDRSAALSHLQRLPLFQASGRQFWARLCYSASDERQMLTSVRPASLGEPTRDEETR